MKKILSGGMNSFPESLMSQSIDFNNLIPESTYNYRNFNNSLKKNNQEIMKNQGLVDIYSSQLQKNLENEMGLIKRRKNLKYQVSDLISDSDLIVKDKMKQLNEMVAYEKKIRKDLNLEKKKNYAYGYFNI